MAAIRELEQIKTAPPSYPIVEFRPLPNPIARRDWEIIQRVQNGEKETFGELYDWYVDKVHRHIYYRMGNKSDAEDLTLLAFTKAFYAVGRYRDTGRPYVNWLLRIANNLIIDHYRDKRETVPLEDFIFAAGDESNPVAVAETHFENASLREAIKKLKRNEQAVVVMRYIDGMEYREIAEALGKSEGNCRLILCRALLKLREIIGVSREELLA